MGMDESNDEDKYATCASQKVIKALRLNYP